MKKVLILSTYPIEKPYHGGQNRLFELSKAYLQAGLQVTNVSVYEEEAYTSSELSADDIPFPNNNKHRLFDGELIPNSTDILAGNFLINDDNAWNKFYNFFQKIRPDIIHLEQPGLFPALEKISIQFGRSNLIIIYGSQNVEFPLKEEIYKNLGINKKKSVQKFIKLVKEREIQAATFSDLTLVVTNADIKWFSNYIPENKLLLIPNGVRKMQYSEGLKEKILKQIEADRWIIYTASAHPPNIQGFFDCVGESLGCIPPDSKLVVAGSVSDFIYRRLRDNQMRFLNLSRLVSFGKVATDLLDTLILGSEAVVLPITKGGGSNLKTAEAIASGKRIIATNKAFVGYEEYSKLKGIEFANNIDEFRQKMREVFFLKPLVRNEKEQTLVKNLNWENTTSPLTNYILETCQ